MNTGKVQASFNKTAVEVVNKIKSKIGNFPNKAVMDSASSDKLQKSMDGLATLRRPIGKHRKIGEKEIKALAKDVKKINSQAQALADDIKTSFSQAKTFNTIKTETATQSFVRQQIESGSTPQEAVNGARAVMTATGRNNIKKSAAASAYSMEEAGLFKKQDMEKLKNELKEKHGEKLAKKKAANLEKAKEQAARQQKINNYAEAKGLLTPEENGIITK